MTQGILKQQLSRQQSLSSTFYIRTTGMRPAEPLMNRKLKSASDLLNPRTSDKFFFSA